MASSRRTYLYKLTSDRGGAPCAIEPLPGERPLLTLAICKPAIRRTAQPGDRILGITSHALAQTDGYRLGAVIYAAIVAEGVDARDYFAPESLFTERPDCIYEFHQQMGRASHRGLSALHQDERHQVRDLGRYPFYKNGRVLKCEDFRYFGAAAVPIPAKLTFLTAAAESLGQGHRVFLDREPESQEADALFRSLWKRTTCFTAREVDGDSYDHRPGKRRAVQPDVGCGSER